MFALSLPVRPSGVFVITTGEKFSSSSLPSELSK